jgi:hypothetical protein
MKEKIIWLSVPGFFGIYKVNQFGTVKSLDHKVICKKCRIQKGRILTTSKNKKGYVNVSLSKKGKRLHTGVHRLVALAFIPNPENKSQVNHKDGNKENNYYKNLEWSTNQENCRHAVKNGLMRQNFAENHHKSKLSNAQILEIRGRLNSGEQGKIIAPDYKVSAATISNVKIGRNYSTAK